MASLTAHVDDAATATLNTMPDDVLVQIFAQLDEVESFALTSKRFKLISQDAFFRARWFMVKHAPCEVIFEAIARGGKIFTADLFHRLLRAGAVLSRNLAQLLYVMHMPSSITGQTQSQWGRSITFDACFAVLTEARKLYGPISLEKDQLDSLTFSKIIAQSGTDRLEDLTLLIEQFRFMPLPLSFASHVDMGAECFDVVPEVHTRGVRSVLLKYPSLAEGLRANGYAANLMDSNWIARSIFMRSSQDTSDVSCPAIVAQLQYLQNANVIKITREVACNVVYTLRSPCDPRLPHSCLGAYLALLELHRDGSLDFDLLEVVAEVIASLTATVADQAMKPLLERVNTDFPSVDIDSLMARLTFIEVEQEREMDLNKIRALMGRHRVTREDVRQASLRNASCSTIPLQYGVKFVHGFHLESFVKELIYDILDQPYRGQMLRQLNGLFHQNKGEAVNGVPLHGTVDFQRLLATAVEGKAFPLESIPAQEWFLDSHGLCNRKAPLRSKLAFSWASGNAPSVNSWQKYRGSPSSGLEDFTYFGPTQQLPAPVDTPSALQEQASVPGTSPHFNPRFLEITESLQMHEHMLAGADYMPRRRWIEWKNSNSLLGSITYRDERSNAIGGVIADLLGSKSRAASVILAHSLLNGNARLADQLITSLVPVTLYHIRVGLKVGYALPVTLFNHILDGASFKASFDAAENEPDTQLRGLKKGPTKITLTPVYVNQEQLTCNKIRGSARLRAAVHVDFSATGALRISGSPSERTQVVRGIIAQPLAVPASSGATDTVQDVQMSEASGSATTTNQAVASIAAQGGLGGAASQVDTEKDEEEQYVYDLSQGWKPVLIGKSELKRRTDSLELWSASLTILRYQDDYKHAALKACSVSSSFMRRSEAHKELSDVLPKINPLLKALRAAVSVATARNGDMLAELAGLWRDIEQNEVGDTVRRRLEWYSSSKPPPVALKRRPAFYNSRCSSFPSAYKIPGYRDTLPPLSDENSEDEDFISNSSSTSDDEDSSSSDEEPVAKRVKVESTDTTASSSSTKG